MYVLKSEKNGQYYTGMTKCLDERLNRHNCGWVKATKHLTPWKLMYSEDYATFGDARSRELYIKGQKSRVYIESLINKCSS